MNPTSEPSSPTAARSCSSASNVYVPRAMTAPGSPNARSMASTGSLMLLPQIPSPKHECLKARANRLAENTFKNREDFHYARTTCASTRAHLQSEIASCQAAVDEVSSQREREQRQKELDQESYNEWVKEWKKRHGFS